MATIKKNRARTFIEKESKPSPSINNLGSDGLRFNIMIGDHKVSLTHYERDTVIESWVKLEKDFEAATPPSDEQKTRRSFELPFADFDYESALPEYDLQGSRRSPRELLVVGRAEDIEKFAIDFSFE